MEQSVIAVDPRENLIEAARAVLAEARQEDAGVVETSVQTTGYFKLQVVVRLLPEDGLSDGIATDDGEIR